jgi:hypothetical protein
MVSFDIILILCRITYFLIEKVFIRLSFEWKRKKPLARTWQKFGLEKRRK